MRLGGGGQGDRRYVAASRSLALGTWCRHRNQSPREGVRVPSHWQAQKGRKGARFAGTFSGFFPSQASFAHGRAGMFVRSGTTVQGRHVSVPCRYTGPIVFCFTFLDFGSRRSSFQGRFSLPRLASPLTTLYAQKPPNALTLACNALHCWVARDCLWARPVRRLTRSLLCFSSKLEREREARKVLLWRVPRAVIRTSPAGFPAPHVHVGEISQPCRQELTVTRR
jgi:hypothetical protein